MDTLHAHQSTLYPEGLASWHPAFRSNTHEHSVPNTEATVEATPHAEEPQQESVSETLHDTPLPAVDDSTKPIGRQSETRDLQDSGIASAEEGHLDETAPASVGGVPINAPEDKEEEPQPSRTLEAGQLQPVVGTDRARSTLEAENTAPESSRSVEAEETQDSLHEQPFEKSTVEDGIAPDHEDTQLPAGQQTDPWDDLATEDDPFQKEFEGAETTFAPIDNEIESAAPDEKPYEHQSDITQADLAVDEAPTAPLLDDAATELDEPSTEPSNLISDDWGQTEDLLQSSELGHHSAAPPQEATDWGLDDGDDFSAALGNDSSKAAQLSQEPARALGGDGVQESSHENIDDNIEDLWAAALDDDDLLNESSTADPVPFFDEDDDGGFLEDIAETPETNDASSTVDQGTASQTRQNPYTPASAVPQSHLHQSVDPRPASTPSTFLPGLAGPFSGSPLSGPEPNATPQLRSTASFVGKSKSGYSSPYDLPTEIVVPRRRPAGPISTPMHAAPAPPPRSSSYAVTSPAAPPAAPVRATSVAPAVASQSGARDPKTSTSGASGFFADLPVVPKARVQRPNFSSPPQAFNPNVPPTQPRSFLDSPGPPNAPVAPQYGGMQRPEKLPLYPEQQGARSVPPQQPLPPATTSRYSPAPNAQQVPQSSRFSPAPPPVPSQNRYAAAPTTSSVPTQQRAHAFIPKTSSPLMYHEGSATSPSRFDTTQGSLAGQAQQIHDSAARSMTPPSSVPRSGSMHSSPQSLSRYATVDQSMSEAPSRPGTRSPVVMKRAPASYQRSADLRGAGPLGFQGPQTAAQQSTGLSLPSRHRSASDLRFDVPRDDRAADELERWKGCPIFRWSPSGTVISTFPKQAPFYAAGHAIPVIRCTAGEITIHDAKSALTLAGVDENFPGPLQGKGKSKKKDVLSWMTNKITALETSNADTRLNPSIPEKLRVRYDEKLILWKVLKLLVEHDNNFDLKSETVESLRKILVPNDIDSQSPINFQIDAERPGSGPDRIDSKVITEIRKLLLEGQRERAVWYATENKLWSHAMVIAGSMGPDIWKQLIHEFVKSQIQSSSDSTRSLAAIYEVFAGNFEESIDELVPPFARAGFSTTNLNGQTGTNGLGSTQGLEKWRETLALILGNRTSNDAQAIASLGRLLGGYGRPEAAQICFVFASSIVRHSGPDDAESAFVLLGSDHKDATTALGSDLDSILLTEIYEYLQSLSPVSGHAPVIPHLQPYKLMHAFQLAEVGHRSKAQTYCDSIVSSIKASTKASPYYHFGFVSAVDDFSRCLSQAPQTAGSSGLFSKLSSDKVSGSMWKRFNSFVAGDEDDAASTTSGGDNLDGPFGKVAGSSPDISRAPSTVDMYGAMSAGQPVNGATSYPAQLSPNKPYTPGHPQAAPASLDRTVSGRYAPQAAGTPASLRNPNAVTNAPRPPELIRQGSSSYAPSPAASRAPSKAYSPYQPSTQQAQPGYNGLQMQNSRPQVARAASDYQPAYVPNADVAPPASAPPTALQSPAPVGSPYKPRSSPLSYEQSADTLHPERSPSVAQSVSSDHLAAGIHGYPPSQHHDFAEDSGSYYAPPRPGFDSDDVPDDVPRSTYDSPAAGYASSAASYAPAQRSYQPSEASYEPPTASFGTPDERVDHGVPAEDEPVSSYQPYEPSYEPYQPDYGNTEEDAEAEEVPKPKKKSFMDLSDDEDIPTRAPPPAQSSAAAQKAEADRIADEAFRKAAEADAARDKAAKEAEAKKGWFGGWFGGKKPGELDQAQQQQPQKAIKAKLGEENSFYFDKELGKWVNKKGGKEDATAAAPTPPPPRAGPPSRVASGVGTPNIPPPSRPGTAANGVASPPMTPHAGPPGGPRPPGSRTVSSAAANLDDLLGAPAAKKGAVKGKKRGGRYVDVMAK